MLIRVIAESEMDSATDAAIRQGLCACFPAHVDVFSQSRAWHGSSPSWSVIAHENDCVAAHAGVVDRTIRVGETSLRVAGIQNVYVLPENRGSGLCEQVMEAVLNEARGRGLDMGLLFCVPGLAKVYGRCGWKDLGCREVIRVDENGREVAIPEKNIVMFSPLAIGEFPEGVIRLQGNDW